MHRGDLGYHTGLDRDGDGIACERQYAGETGSADEPATTGKITRRHRGMGGISRDRRVKRQPGLHQVTEPVTGVTACCRIIL